MAACSVCIYTIRLNEVHVNYNFFSDLMLLMNIAPLLEHTQCLLYDVYKCSHSLNQNTLTAGALFRQGGREIMHQKVAQTNRLGKTTIFVYFYLKSPGRYIKGFISQKHHSQASVHEKASWL